MEDLTKSTSSSIKPSNFDEYWANARAELDRVPVSLTSERSTLRSTSDVDTFEIAFASLSGLRIFGWLCLPVGRTKCPGLVIYPGYGGSPAIPRAWAKLGYVALQVSPRGHHKSDGIFNPGFPGLMTSGIDDPIDYVYRGIYCDAWRAVDVLLGRSEVDRTRIGVTGGSQGGGLALVAAAGCPEVVAVAADVPFLTSIRDAMRIGNSFPYEEVKDFIRVLPTSESRLLTTLDYIDAINFADQITAPTLVSVGLRDDVCPPETAYALYNRLSCPKEIRAYPDGGHEGGGFVHAQYKQDWLGARLMPGS